MGWVDNLYNSVEQRAGAVMPERGISRGHRGSQISANPLFVGSIGTPEALL